MPDAVKMQRIMAMTIAAFGAIVSSTFPLSIIFAQQDICRAPAGALQISWVLLQSLRRKLVGW